jgi:hypothetical protein
MDIILRAIDAALYPKTIGAPWRKPSCPSIGLSQPTSTCSAGGGIPGLQSKGGRGRGIVLLTVKPTYAGMPGKPAVIHVSLLKAHNRVPLKIPSWHPALPRPYLLCDGRIQQPPFAGGLRRLACRVCRQKTQNNAASLTNPHAACNTPKILPMGTCLHSVALFTIKWLSIPLSSSSHEKMRRNYMFGRRYGVEKDHPVVHGLNPMGAYLSLSSAIN